MSRIALPPEVVETRLIAIGRRLDSEDLDSLVVALHAGGVRVLEITMDGEGALDQIERLAGGPLLIGAGTVMSVEEADRAVSAGAAFIVSPHSNLEIVSWAVQNRVPVLPGAMTPTEIVAAWDAGASAVKVFPASAGGPGFIKNVKGPLSEVLLVPTGGIDKASAAAYLAAGATAVGVGGWLTGVSDPAVVRERAEALAAACS